LLVFLDIPLIPLKFHVLRHRKPPQIPIVVSHTTIQRSISKS
jgi:hypothetical protein